MFCDSMMCIFLADNSNRFSTSQMSTKAHGHYQAHKQQFIILVTSHPTESTQLLNYQSRQPAATQIIALASRGGSPGLAICPQRWVLSPIIYFLYVENMTVPDPFTIIKYADDMPSCWNTYLHMGAQHYKLFKQHGVTITPLLSTLLKPNRLFSKTNKTKGTIRPPHQ